MQLIISHNLNNCSDITTYTSVNLSGKRVIEQVVNSLTVKNCSPNKHARKGKALIQHVNKCLKSTCKGGDQVFCAKNIYQKPT